MDNQNDNETPTAKALPSSSGSVWERLDSASPRPTWRLERDGSTADLWDNGEDRTLGLRYEWQIIPSCKCGGASNWAEAARCAEWIMSQNGEMNHE